MTLRSILVASIALFVVTACEQDVELDIPAGDQQVVVEGWVHLDEAPVVLLSRSTEPYGDFGLTSFLDSTFVRGATVSVNGWPLQEVRLQDLPDRQKERAAGLFSFPKEVLTLYPDLDPALQQVLADTAGIDTATLGAFIRLPAYSDTTGTIRGQEFGVYGLTADVGDERVTATTTIPRLSGLDSLSFAYIDDEPGFAEVYLHITVPSDVNRYIRYATKRNDEPFLYPDAGGSVFDNGIYAGQGSIRLPVERAYPDGADPEPAVFGLFEVGDTVVVEWSDIDRQTFDYWFTVENDGGDSPFSSATRILSNVNGGLGVWAGYGSNRYVIHVP